MKGDGGGRWVSAAPCGLRPCRARQPGLVAAAAEAVEAALARLVAAEAAQRREHACVDAALLLVALLHVVRVGHLLPRRRVIHLGEGWVGLLWKKKVSKGCALVCSPVALGRDRKSTRLNSSH